MIFNIKLKNTGKTSFYYLYFAYQINPTILNPLYIVLKVEWL